ncbi:type II toxin-antitoxin system RelE family toxin [Thiohalocapsa halophila]|uniref:type II toxin-antitoxin system RelE family toxin n=1 Tax=Thiohalocapsa halophila TaxID=69359 RepID=UPI0034DABE04
MSRRWESSRCSARIRAERAPRPAAAENRGVCLSAAVTSPQPRGCIHKKDATRIARRLSELEAGLSRDIKRLTNFTPEYRLRVGNCKVLFEVEDDTVVVYRVMHRKHVYAKR